MSGRPALPMLLVLLACAAWPGAGPPPGETRYVVAATTLLVRAAAAGDAPVLGEAAHGGVVVVTGPAAGSATVDGIAGAWAPVWHDGVRGFAFDGFLLAHPAPPATCGGLEEWAAAIGFIGEERAVERVPCARIGSDEPGECDIRWQRPLAGGGRLERVYGYDWHEDRLFLPSVPRDAFWAAARTCVDGPGGRRPLPTTAGRLPETAGVTELEAIAGPDRWGWSWFEGCQRVLTVDRVDGGMEVRSVSSC
jgi:hypothetical protein